MNYREELFKALTAGVDGVFRDESIDALVEVCRAARKEGYKNGYQEGCNDKQHDLECDYAKGLADAWECARSVINNKVPFEFWNLASGQSNLEVFKHYSATGAIEKIKEYEREQKKAAEIKIGDEVHAIYDDTPMVVVSIFNEDVTGEKRVVSVSISGIISNLYVDELIRTGRHFPEIAEVLKQMQEGNK